MALLDSEVARIKAELGYSLLSQGQVYIGTAAIFEQVIQVYLGAGATTTSATDITGDGTPKSITLTSATGFAAGARVVVDVDGRQETVTVQALSGTTLTALFLKTHTGTYPVTVEGGETLAREKLVACQILHEALTGAADGTGALKRAEDIEWHPPAPGTSQYRAIREDLMLARDELASVLGVENLWRRKQSSGARLSVY